MYKKIIYVFVLTLFVFGLSFSVVNAGPKETATSGLGGALGNLGKSTAGSKLPSELETTLGSVIKGALSLVGTIFLILTVYAGILWMTAQGNDDQIDKAVKIIKASVVGLFITMSAYAITYFITTKLGG